MHHSIHIKFGIRALILTVEVICRNFIYRLSGPSTFAVDRHGFCIIKNWEGILNGISLYKRKKLYSIMTNILLKQKRSIVGRARLWIPISYFITFNKTLFKISFSFNFGFHRLTLEIKIKLIFGFLMKFYMKLTSILHILNLLFRSASFGKLRLSS